MKKVILMFVGLLSFVSAHAADLSQEALQGNWAITESMGMADTGEDMWIFEGDIFTQYIEGMRIAPDKFTVAPGVIDLDYSKITVTSFDGSVMQATWAGVKYTLTKK